MKTILMTLMTIFALTGCAKDSQGVNEATTVAANSQPYTRQSRISDVINDQAFGDFGRLLFPVDDGYWSGTTLEDLRLTWYTGIDPDKTVEIVNTLKSQAEAGQTVFYDIYTEAEKQADRDKRDTGLFFFKGMPLPSSIAQGGRRPMKTSPAQSPLYTTMPTNWGYHVTATPSGADRLVLAWLRRSATVPTSVS